MKKKIIALVLVTGMTMSSVALANNWRGGDRGYGRSGQCSQGPVAQMNAPDDATKEKIKQFLKDNVELKKQMVMKRAEKRAMMRSEAPDPKAVAQVTGELFDLKTSFMEKAEAAGVSEYIGPRGRMGKRGHDRPMFGKGKRFSMNDGTPQQ